MTNPTAPSAPAAGQTPSETARTGEHTDRLVRLSIEDIDVLVDALPRDKDFDELRKILESSPRAEPARADEGARELLERCERLEGSWPLEGNMMTASERIVLRARQRSVGADIMAVFPELLALAKRLAALSPAKEPVAQTREALVWLIESKDYKGDSQWWGGMRHWTEALRAVWFSRKQDAEMVLLTLQSKYGEKYPGFDDAFVTEHEFVAASPPQQAAPPNVEAAARAYCRRHHPGAEKWSLDEALTNVDRYWKRYVHEVTEILEAAQQTAPVASPATHDDIPRCPKCDSSKTCFHCEHCGENF